MPIASPGSSSDPALRQAVVVIHGIGEQQPMATLRGFVDAVLESPEEGDAPYFSRPDLLSGNFELRCLRTPGNTRPRTDFFEFYWAHLMPTASWYCMFDWASLLMRRSLTDIPRKFRVLWWGLWVSTVLVSFALLATTLEWIWPTIGYRLIPANGLLETNNLPLAIILIALIIQGAFLSSAGDAATYLSPSPHNVAARHAIRATGVELLERLHSSGEYNRIVVVGHSLGSVIGYDLIRHLWNRYCEKHGTPTKPSREAMERAESLATTLRNGGVCSAETLREEWKQTVREVFEELRNNDHPWRVTDFITLGSPLAHADLLLAPNRRDLRRQFRQRELPMSPPVADSKGSFSNAFLYERPDGSKRSTFVPHHAAWTASVCWTNLYFPSRGLLYGDAIGGPLAPLFGPGVIDQPVRTQRRRGWLTHTAYWDRVAADAALSDGSLTRLRQALRLNLYFP